MLNGIYESVRKLSNHSLYLLQKEFEEKETKGKWLPNSQAEYYIDEFQSKYGISRDEIESMLLDALTKVSSKRFKKLFEAIRDVEYEASTGTHTRHACSCNRSSARRQCVLCIVDSCK